MIKFFMDLEMFWKIISFVIVYVWIFVGIFSLIFHYIRHGGVILAMLVTAVCGIFVGLKMIGLEL